MKIISWNVNGIRACIKKGFWDWYDAQNADVLCLQETKITTQDFEHLANAHELSNLITPAHQLELETPVAQKRKTPVYFALASAKRPGYSGVALLCKTRPEKLEMGLGDPQFDDEGRTIFAYFKNLILVTSYVPNGGRDLERIPYKLSYSDCLLKKLQSLRKKHKNIIICGDMNVAHTEFDIKNPKSNMNNSGFTQIERDWFTKFLSHKYIDVFRHKNPEARDCYTWWSYRPGVREKNVGWRIDYFVVTEEMLPMVKSTAIQAQQFGSDHCPIELVVS